ncbi:MAG: hypothetical protein E7001_00530 [Coriobacteriaceae bacterium]|nr:hypothetical protein [Coriobacteriaceae bacterium]
MDTQAEAIAELEARADHERARADALERGVRGSLYDFFEGCATLEEVEGNGATDEVEDLEGATPERYFALERELGRELENVMVDFGDGAPPQPLHTVM